MRFSKRERKILKLMQKKKLSPSHELDHLKRVAEFGSGLSKIHGGKREIVVGAALLHDLARSDLRFRGTRSAKRGARLAKPILVKSGYSPEEVRLISQCIAEHDQPQLRSKLLESRILKDADFLDGFGARGILRSIMYAGETGEGAIEAIERLKNKGRKRLKALEFVESRRLGWRRQRLTETFLEELERAEDLRKVSYSGKLVVIEGISGSGKDVQARLLANYFRRQGRKVRVVHHPTPFLKKLWRMWREKVEDPLSELFLLLADRVRMVRSEIMPALAAGEVVISTRSQISAQVYQFDKDYPEAFYRYLFAFEPVADLVIYLDVSASEALKRSDQRVVEGVEKNRGFFGRKQEKERERYKRVLRHYPNVFSVDANPGIEAVAASVRQVVNKKGLLELS